MYANFDKIIKRKRVSTYSVSKGTGIPQSTFSDWKKGKSSPKVKKLMKIADYLGVSLEELVRDNN
ncbi:MAG: family transcriptional regulator [Clostridiales bacterium]|jgi:repressor LexA|nr:family transcriptional regulator [Clostridiales bacterium]